MSDASDQDAEQLSALADGELDSADVARICSRWRAGESSQATWHAYHLIGDVLRSEDLARSATQDHRSLAMLRTRLAAEPAILAPATMVTRPTGAGRGRSTARIWGSLAAVAAGFAAVAAVLVVMRTVSGPPQGVSLAAAPTGAALAVSTPVRPLDREPLVLAADGKVVRDVRLDRYLDAHKHFAGSSALGVPSSFLRGATSDASNR